SKVVNRVSSINSEDESSSQRLRYYKQAINYSLQNPVMGAGIGNWKLKSIDEDKNNIYSYIIPYNTHNDFLEILAETNFVGFFFYLFFFISIFWILYRAYFNAKDLNLRDSTFLCFAALLVYFIDANLNFPLYRPIMQINLLIILT
ncbi:MAG: O-antigen ligase family protein, partial [Flavobacteriaceae bacterium]